MSKEIVGDSVSLDERSLYDMLVHGVDVEPSKEVLKDLGRKNPILRPDNLKKLDGLEGFAEFSPVNYYGDNDNILWIRQSQKDKFLSIISDGNTPLTILFSGLGTSGKNTILDKVIGDDYLNLHISKPLTTTTRDKRDSETYGRDYEFIDKRTFLFKANDDEFVEAVDQYGNYYGTRVEHLNTALELDREILISQVEVGGWSKVSDFIISKTNMPIISTFLLPERKYKDYLSFLREQRGQKDFEKRSNRAVWELEKASKIADIMLVNKTNVQYPGVGVSDYLTMLLSEILSNRS